MAADRDPVAPAPADPAEGESPGVGERLVAWLAPRPAELLALVLLLLGSVVATLLWWYGSVTAPGAPTAAVMAGDAFDGDAAGDDPTDDPMTEGVPGSDAAVGPPGPPAAEGAGTPQPTAPAEGDAAAGAVGDTPVLVHVSGAVRRPGLLALPAGARVGDAVAAAGGLTEEADGPAINLARVVADGEQVHVPVEGEERVLPPPGAVDAPGAAGPGPAGGEGVDGEGRVDLNLASAAELETLPGIGPTRAAAIVAHRQEHGPFRVPGDLRAVSGIGEATFQNLAPLIVVR